MGKTSKVRFNNDYLEVSSGILRALAHPLRLRMLGMLYEQEPLSVHAIYTNLQIEQSVASQHLRILRDAQLVFTERQGKFVAYKVNSELLERAGQVVPQLIKKQNS